MSVHQSRLRARVAVLLAATLVAAAACDPAASPSPSAGAEQWVPQTAWERAVVDVDENGRYSKDAALTLFATAYGPLPGVAAKQDEKGIFSRTLAIRAISRVEAELSEEQRAAIDAYLTPPADAITVDIPPVATLGTMRLVKADPGLAQAIREVAEEARIDIAANMGGDFDGFMTVSFIPRPADVKPIDGVYPNGGAQPQFLFGTFVGCRISIYDEATTQSGLQLTALMTHEVFHCFQDAILKTRDNYDDEPAWISEGQATWVGMELGGPSPNYQRFWDRYLLLPGISLLNRAYDAVGFYAHLKESGIDPWTVFRPMLEVAGDDLASYLAAGADSEAFVDTWASSVLRQGVPSSPWNTDGPGITQSAYSPLTFSVGNGSSFNLAQAAFTNDIDYYDLESDLVEIEIDGHARLKDDANDMALHGAALFCVAGHDCSEVTCEGDTVPVQTDGTIGPRIALAMSGGHEGLNGSLRGRDVDDPENCESDEPPSPPPPDDLDPCQTTCAESDGDVHITTFGQFGYDFQGVGEFVLARSADEAFEVQTRQSRLGGSKTVSINTALAVKAGDQRMTLSIDVVTSTVRLSVNGAETPLVAGQPVAFGSGQITAYPDGVAIDTGDGSHVWVVGMSYRGFNLLVEPGEARQAGIVGLMGHNPEGSRYPALPDGSSVGAESFDRHENYVQLYQTFADAWRVTSASSLFDYGPGESTGTFSIANFPAEVDLIYYEDLTEAQKQAGEAACQDVTDRDLHRMCVYDVGVTADPGYAETYENHITLLETGSLGESGERVRIVNLYANEGVGTALDVYAWAGDATSFGLNEGTGPALVATVPYGAATEWFNPGQMTNGPFDPVNWITVQRQGEQILGWHFNLFDLASDSRPGTERVIVITSGGPDDISIVGGTAASWNQVLEEAPEGYFPLEDPPAGKGLAFLNPFGMFELQQATYWAASVNGRCLTPPDFPTLATIVQGTSPRAGVLEPGSYEVAVHEFPQGDDNFDLNCGRYPVAARTNVSVEAGDRVHLFVYAEAAGEPVQVMALPGGG